jgi:hypothetical protein
LLMDHLPASGLLKLCFFVQQSQFAGSIWGCFVALIWRLFFAVYVVLILCVFDNWPLCRQITTFMRRDDQCLWVRIDIILQRSLNKACGKWWQRGRKC